MATELSFSLAYTGTGTAQTFSCGFEPSYVRICDTTDHTFAEFIAGTCVVGSTILASNGISVTASYNSTTASGPTAEGGLRAITLGTDNSVNKNGSAYLLWACK